MQEMFKKCVKENGKVKTKDLGNGKMMMVCTMGNKSYQTKAMSKEEMMMAKKEMAKMM